MFLKAAEKKALSIEIISNYNLIKIKVEDSFYNKK
jgi:hypothetical protein